MSELTAREVLAILFEELLVQNSEELAAIVIQRLIDAGFEIVPADRANAAQAMPEETQPCYLTQLLRQ